MIDNPETQETLAELAESTGAALLAFAQAVSPAADGDSVGADLATLKLGRRQREIATLAGLDTEEGLASSQSRARSTTSRRTRTPRCKRSPRAASPKDSATGSTPAGD